ncbi:MULTISPECIES: GIY-YIG nuclease family protein [Symbiopectobacterium]|uniref:GIY-YIG nuclease family protein n=1 Tax=Symbiopectobacterium TaxID=801 RepID=UPI0020796BF7|nr:MULTISPECIES: GIY-YIG nuclease family protein [Symbiopectobacterium]
MPSSVYILTNKPNGTLYIGVTSNLIRRIWQRNNLKTRGFAHQYNVNQLFINNILKVCSWQFSERSN